MRHDEITLRLLSASIGEVGAEEATADSCSYVTDCALDGDIIGEHSAGQIREHCLVEGREGGRNSTLLNDEAIKRVVQALPAVDDTSDTRPNGTVWWGIFASHAVDILASIVASRWN